MVKNDLVGRKFGRLTAIKFMSDKHKWLCQCDCGEFKEVEEN